MTYELPIVTFTAEYCLKCKRLLPTCEMGQHYHRAKWLKVLCKCLVVTKDKQLELFEVVV